MGYYAEFPLPIPHLGARRKPLLALPPLSPIAGFSFDLHALATPPAFNLSQDQTLQLNFLARGASPAVEPQKKRLPVLSQPSGITPEGPAVVQPSTPKSLRKDREAGKSPAIRTITSNLTSQKEIDLWHEMVRHGGAVTPRGVSTRASALAGPARTGRSLPHHSRGVTRLFTFQRRRCRRASTSRHQPRPVEFRVRYGSKPQWPVKRPDLARGQVRPQTPLQRPPVGEKPPPPRRPRGRQGGLFSVSDPGLGRTLEAWRRLFAHRPQARP